MLSSGDRQWDYALGGRLSETIATRTCRLLSMEGLRVFLEPLLPSDVAVIFSGGHGAMPLTNLCSYLGFEVVLVDERTSFLNEKRFPRWMYSANLPTLMGR